ncbi:MAG TPA: TrkA C-terminal domain-containing protein [Aquihabitans sp.]|nr:TrkA C-terminal domain-containing protein [Aquihabitans sp.]
MPPRSWPRSTATPGVAGSPVLGESLRSAHLRDRTGALVLALRDGDGAFHTNPSADTELRAGQVVSAIGTPAELAALARLVAT